MLPRRRPRDAIYGLRMELHRGRLAVAEREFCK